MTFDFAAIKKLLAELGPAAISELLASGAVPLIDGAVATIGNPFLSFGWKIFKIFLTSPAGAAAIHAEATKP